MTTNTTKPTTHTVITADGEKHTRKSARVYTHAIVLTLGDAFIESYISIHKADIAHATKSLAKYEAVIASGVCPAEFPSSKMEDYIRYAADCKERIAKSEAGIAVETARLGKGWQKQIVFGWSQSMKNAGKQVDQARRLYAADRIEIVEVTRA